MSSVLCALCDVEITEQNESKEHIIPNSIGGRKKISGFICKDCNNKSVHAWDNELANDLNPLSLFLGIKRGRGKAPSQAFGTTSGEEVQLHSDGRMSCSRPQYSENKVGEQTIININARSIQEARSILKGIKRKYPTIDINQAISSYEEHSSYISGMLKFNLSFGGQKTGRSVVKSVMALAVESGVNPKDCDNAREYLLNEHSELCFGYYYEKDLVTNRPDGIPIHCVFVKGDPNTRQLIGYAEFFGFQRMIVCLSEKYDGGEFTNCYSIDPVNGKELDVKVDLCISSENIKAVYNYEKIDHDLYKEAIEKVISMGVQNSFKREMNRVIDQAMEHISLNFSAKEGEILTDEHVEELVRLFMEKMEPFIIHNTSRIRE